MSSSQHKASVRNIYGFAAIASVLTLLLVFLKAGPSAVLPVLVLAVIEITFSFENAVINSQVLSKFNKFWQTVFLTLGIAIAVFGVRLILPLILVSGTSGHSMSQVISLALHSPDQYASELNSAYPLIAAFGGVFLLLIGLRFFGERREVRWLNTVEAPLAEFNQPWGVVIAGVFGAVAVIYFFLTPHSKAKALAGLMGGAAFLIIKLISSLLMRFGTNYQKKTGKLDGKAALAQFIYLELLDASFSFDGVVAAFAVTKEVVLIAAGLGIGALFVRSITLHLLRRGTLEHYRYLIHGAHYAILSLAVVMLAGIKYHIPEFMTGLLGLVFIGAAIRSSIQHNQQQAV